jgi:hypothetical protein
MLVSNHLIGFGAGGGVAPATIAYVADTQSTSNLTTYTFSGHSIGASASKTVFVCVGAGQNSPTISVSSLTIGGVSASLVVANNDGYLSEIWRLDGVTGTTADIVVTLNAGSVRCSIGVYEAHNVAAAADDTATSVANPMTTGAGFTIPKDGIGLGFAYSAGGSITHTWNSVLTEDFDTTSEGAVGASGASLAFAAAQSTEITATASGGSPRFGSFASFGAA